jgi:hypothetical protein
MTNFTVLAVNTKTMLNTRANSKMASSMEKECVIAMANTAMDALRMVTSLRHFFWNSDRRQVKKG